MEGLAAIGIESDGSVKADPTLPSEPYIGGNVRQRPLREIVEHAQQLTYNLGAGTAAGTAHLWGFCRSCEFAELCRGGDTFTAHSFFDRRGNHPYCHHRALVQDRRGLRERLAPRMPASGRPYDNGVFEIIEEGRDDPWPGTDPLRFTAEDIRWPPDWPADDGTAGVEVGAVPVRNPPPDGLDGAAPLLPRSPWSSSFSLMSELIRAKRALDRAEREEAEGALPLERPHASHQVSTTP